jgi:hypothetical protein
MPITGDYWGWHWAYTTGGDSDIYTASWTVMMPPSTAQAQIMLNRFFDFGFEDDGAAEGSVLQYTYLDQQGNTQTVNFPSPDSRYGAFPVFFAHRVTSVTFAVDVIDAYGEWVYRIDIWGPDRPVVAPPIGGATPQLERQPIYLDVAGDLPRPKASHTLAFYEPVTGRIRYLHHLFVIDGAVSPSERELPADATRTAAHAGADVRHLEVLHVKDHVFDPGRICAVDPASKRLVSKVPAEFKRRSRRRR